MAWAPGFPGRQWSCEDCARSARTHEARGRCGGPLAATLDGAAQDAEGIYITADVACGATSIASFDGGPTALPWLDDARIRSCPIALAGDVWASALHAVADSTSGGVALPAVGVGELSEGARIAAGVILEARAWRTQVVTEVHRARKPKGGG